MTMNGLFQMTDEVLWAAVRDIDQRVLAEVVTECGDRLKRTFSPALPHRLKPDPYAR